MTDPINPDHYKSAAFELIDVIDAFGLSFYEAQVVKYVVRARKKNGLEDLKKAKWYLDRLIANGERQKTYAQQSKNHTCDTIQQRAAATPEAAFGRVGSPITHPAIMEKETWR